MYDMGKIKKISVIEYTIITLLWMLIFIAPLLFGNEFDRNWNAIYTVWIEYTFIFVLFVVNRFVLMPLFFFKEKYGMYFLFVLGLLAVIFLIVTYGDAISRIMSYITGEPDLFPRYSFHSKPIDHNYAFPRSALSPTPIVPPFLNVLVLSILTIGLDFGLTISLKWLQSQKKQAEKETESANVQLAHLQSQVSPHFFMNTLNNIHALVAINPEKAQDTIIELSRLMDYLLYETNAPLVSLKKELTFIENYVKLMGIRYSSRVRIDFHIDKNVPKVKIPPLLFLNFIENAFKHGISYTEKSFVEIKLGFGHKIIELDIKNSNYPKESPEKNRGLGIDNAKKRLTLLYDEAHKLEIDNNVDCFHINLKIPTSL